MPRPTRRRSRVGAVRSAEIDILAAHSAAAEWLCQSLAPSFGGHRGTRADKLAGRLVSWHVHETGSVVLAESRPNECVHVLCRHRGISLDLFIESVWAAEVRREQ